jgi:DNA-binding MltR family transcriptional regulator
LQLSKNRSAVHNEIKKYPKAAMKNSTWKKIEHYYQIRCKLVHEKATVGISDAQIEDFREVVESVLKKLYKLKFVAA